MISIMQYYLQMLLHNLMCIDFLSEAHVWFMIHMYMYFISLVKNICIFSVKSSLIIMVMFPKYICGEDVVKSYSPGPAFKLIFFSYTNHYKCKTQLLRFSVGRREKHRA